MHIVHTGLASNCIPLDTNPASILRTVSSDMVYRYAGEKFGGTSVITSNFFAVLDASMNPAGGKGVVKNILNALINKAPIPAKGEEVVKSVADRGKEEANIFMKTMKYALTYGPLVAGVASAAK